MKQERKETATKSLRNKYRISIGLLVMLVLFNQILVQHATKLQQEDAELINVAGKQRMYSQRIVKAALGICQEGTAEEKARYRLELWASLQEWEQNHRKLQSEYGKIKSIFAPDTDLNQLYSQIHPPFQEMSRAARQLILYLDSPGLEEGVYQEQLKILQRAEPLFLG